ncbi:MAG TPA: LuxR C-terminal-related transcriptional regulator [Micromonosporaceae bacterium]|nr:LuxR C-terminal-related transcriptional regulator [Micromonosporaceae bacterium]
MPDNLPIPRTSFVGRTGDLDRIERLVGEAAVVTVIGTGGVGKTRLAIEAARRLVPGYPDGVWFAELAAIRSVEVAVAEVARLVGVTPGSGDPVRLLVEQLGDRRVLLVVDNCEHLVEGVALLVHRLVTACPRVRVLATSREPLAVGPEVTVPLAPLDGPEAVRLFLDRAGAADPAAPVGDEASVAAVCARLDHIPLAIELAAPWIRVFTPAELLPRLADRFDVLAASRRDLPSRQRTMRAAVDWSYELLTAEQRVLFHRLAVFNGTFALDAAEAVCGTAPLAPGEVGALLAALWERSMVVVDRSGAGSRYRLLETLRDFAAERLGAAGELDATRRRHFDFFRDRAARIDDDRLRTGSDAQVATLVPDADNYRAALGWGVDTDPAGTLRLAAALEGLWMIRSVAEGAGWVERSLAAAPEPTTHRARALIVAPLVVAGGLPWARARSLIQESIDIYAAADDRVGGIFARLMMSLSAMFSGELVEAERHVTDVRRHDLDHPLVRARADTYLGAVLLWRPRRLEEARHLLRRGFEASHAIDDGWGGGLALTLLGLADLRAGYRDVAGRNLREALRTNLQGGVTATAVGGLGELAGRDDPSRALVLLEAAEAVRERAGVRGFPVFVAKQLDRAREAARGRMAGPVADRCRERARAMTTDEVLAFALADGKPAAAGEADRLTARQQEVALLVADGLTNRQIAARLHLSVRTVETHVDNILTTLGFHSRARLAGWVRDAGLHAPPAG